jgi:hypothetical protein
VAINASRQSGQKKAKFDLLRIKVLAGAIDTTGAFSCGIADVGAPKSERDLLSNDTLATIRSFPFFTWSKD